MLDAISASVAGTASASYLVRADAAIKAAARLLGLPEQEIRRLLKKGNNLQEIAQSHNVNRGELVTTIRKAFQTEGSRMDYHAGNRMAQAFVSRRGTPTGDN